MPAVCRLTSNRRKSNFEKAANARWDERQLLTKIGWLKIWRTSLILIMTLASSIIMNIIFPSAGKNINIAYYETLAQIFPILLIAIYIERPIAENLRRRTSREAKFYNKQIKIYGFWRFSDQFDNRRDSMSLRYCN